MRWRDPRREEAPSRDNLQIFTTKNLRPARAWIPYWVQKYVFYRYLTHNVSVSKPERPKSRLFNSPSDSEARWEGLYTDMRTLLFSPLYPKVLGTALIVLVSRRVNIHPKCHLYRRFDPKLNLEKVVGGYDFALHCNICTFDYYNKVSPNKRGLDWTGTVLLKEPFPFFLLVRLILGFFFFVKTVRRIAFKFCTFKYSMYLQQCVKEIVMYEIILNF